MVTTFDGYRQWCTQFARIAQGIYGASAQSFIVLRVQIHTRFHTELFFVPMETARRILGLSVILSLQFTYVISFSELVSILSYQSSGRLRDFVVAPSNQENPGGCWIFPQPTLYFTDLMAAESG